MKNSKLLKSCLALSMVFGTNGYLMTNISAEGEAEETLDSASVSTTSNSSEGQDETNAESQNIGGDQTSSQTATDYSSLITDSLTYNEDKTIAVLTICVNTTDSVTLDFSNSDQLTESMTNSNYAINNELTNGTTTYAFNIAKNGTYNFDAIVLDAEENIVGTKSFTENVTELTDTGEIQGEYNNQNSTTTYKSIFKPTIDNLDAQEVAYYYWHTSEDTSNISFTPVTSNDDIVLNDYVSSDNPGYILFFVKPKEGYLFTGLGADGLGQYFTIDGPYAVDGIGIAGYPNLSAVITAAQSEGYKAVFGWSRTTEQAKDETFKFEINTNKPTLNIQASVAGNDDVKIGDEITFNVTLTPSTTATNATLDSASINSATINGSSADSVGELTYDENNKCYTTTVTHKVTSTDFDASHNGKVELIVNASVTYSISIGATNNGKISTTSTITETGTADPAPTITLKSLDLKVGDDEIGSTEDSATEECKTYDGEALKPSVTAKDGNTVVGDITTKYYVKNNNEYEYVGTEAPSLTDAGSKSVKVVVSKTGYADSVGYYTLEVKERPVTFTGNSGTKVYNGQTQTVTGFTDTSTGENTGLVSGHTATMDARVSGKNVSATPYSGTITNANEVVIKDASNNVVTSNYKITTTPGTLTITKAKGLTISSNLDNDKAEKTYDGKPLSTTATSTGEGTTITYYVKNANGDYENVETTAPSIIHVGEKQVKAVATNPNYENEAVVEYTLKVTKKDVTIKVNNASKVYGQADPTFEKPIVSGLITQSDLGEVSVTRTNTDNLANTYNEVLTATYTDNSDYNVIIEKGNFTIKAQSLNSESDDYTGVIVDSPKNVVYDGNEHVWTPTIKSGETTLDKKDYTVKYYRNGVETTDFTNVGEITVVIEGKGNYTGTITTTYQITPAPIVEDTETDTPRFTISEIDSVVYNGTSQKQAPVIKDGDKELKEGQDYKLTYSEDTTNAGEITVTIEGLGNYAGKVTKTYNILQKQVTVTVKDNSKVFGSKDPELKVDVKGYVEGEADKISCLVSRDAGEDVGKYDIVAHGKTSQGNYLVEYVPATFTITSQSISSEDKDSYGNVEIGTLNSVVYNGTSQKQAPVIKDGDKELKEGQDYKLTYSEDTTNAGEITVTIEGLGNYAGKVTKTYTIMKVNSSANVSGISSKYNGSNQILVTDAKVEGGTIYYSLDGKTYSTNMPEKKESGTYTIYYYVKGDKNHNDLGSESKPLTVEAKIVEEEKAESESKVKTSTATHTFFFESMGVAAAGLFIALRKRMNK